MALLFSRINCHHDHHHHCADKSSLVLPLFLLSRGSEQNIYEKMSRTIKCHIHTHTLLPYSQFSIISLVYAHIECHFYFHPLNVSISMYCKPPNSPTFSSFFFSRSHNVRKVQETFGYDEMKSKSTTHNTQLCSSSRRSKSRRRE